MYYLGTFQVPQVKRPPRLPYLTLPYLTLPKGRYTRLVSPHCRFAQQIFFAQQLTHYMYLLHVPITCIVTKGEILF